MSARRILVPGTDSYVRKSVVTAALCCYFREEGFRIATFKARNMSNSSFVTPDGREISRAQAFTEAVWNRANGGNESGAVETVQRPYVAGCGSGKAR